MQYVEYIQNGEGTSRSTGWAIPLNYHPSITTDVRMVVKFDNVGNDGYLLVGSMNGDGNFFRLFSYQVRTMTFDCPNDSNARLHMTWNGLTEMEMGVDSNGAYYLRNLTTSRTVTATSVNQRLFESDFYLFNDGRGGDCFQGQKIYYIEIYENGTKVKDYRPAKDNNNVVCIYETIGHTYHYCGKTLIAGPSLSSIIATPSKSSLQATGETISISVDCENAWTVTGNTFLSLSSTGDTGSTTITATAPSYSGATARTDMLTFTDTVTGDEFVVPIRQKKYSLGQPVYLGGDEITELYLGSHQISEAYLGDVLVFSSAPAPTPTPTPTGKTLTINNVAIANSMGETVNINVENNGTGYLTYDSIFDDSRGEADNTFSVPTGYTYTFDDENGVITFSGPFDLAGGYEVTCERSSPNMGPCESVHYSFPVVWTGDAATVNTDWAPTIDPECECIEQGGSWDGSECTYPEDPCGGDPCCEQGISDPAECDCMMTGGWWDGSECHYEEPPVDPCIEDPCSCDPNPDECYCIQNGGTWDGSECQYPE